MPERGDLACQIFAFPRTRSHDSVPLRSKFLPRTTTFDRRVRLGLKHSTSVT